MERRARGAGLTAEPSLPVELVTCTSLIWTLSASPIVAVTLIPARAAGAAASYRVCDLRIRRFPVPSKASG
jgi:hypothetical protein